MTCAVETWSSFFFWMFYGSLAGLVCINDNVLLSTFYRRPVDDYFSFLSQRSCCDPGWGIAMNQSIRWNEVSLVSFCGPVDGLKHTLPYLIVVF